MKYAIDALIDAANGEAVEHVVVSTRQPELRDRPLFAGFKFDRAYPFDHPDMQRVLRAIDVETGYGIDGGLYVRAYTASNVIIECTYDGDTWFDTVPRNPSNDPAWLYGGG